MLAYVLFTAFVLLMLAIDLGVFHRTSHAVSIREAMTWTVVWIALAMCFNVLVYFIYQNHWFDLGLAAAGQPEIKAREAAMVFLAGYLVEYSLSVDNIFIFILLFGYFRVPAQYQHRVLFWGILGALLMRAGFIAAGAALVRRFDWVFYIFGLFLLYTGYKMIGAKDKEMHPEQNIVLRLFRKLMPVTHEFEGQRFFVMRDGVRHATPLFVVLLLVETTDVIFAVDSIPAIFGITKEPFIVFTSNIFAILGLRSLYFALGGMMAMFHYLQYGLAAILMFIGAKMVAKDWWHPSIPTALGVIVGILAISVLASLIWPRRDQPAPAAPAEPSA